MKTDFLSIGCTLTLVCLGVWAWKVLKWVWLKPKWLERYLRQQDLSGNSYRLFHGDMKDMFAMKKSATSKPINLSDDIRMRVVPFQHYTIKKHGKKSFMWVGSSIRLNIMDLKMIKDILSDYRTFQRPMTYPQARLLTGGLIMMEGDQWAKNRKIINPAFHLDKLKLVVPAIHLSCEEMLRQWEKLAMEKGSYELDVYPYLENMMGDVISRAAFGSSFEEGRRIFQLQKDQAVLFSKLLQSTYIPGWRFLPTKANKKMKEICNEVNVLIRGIIQNKETAMKLGEAFADDLLGTMLKSNLDEIHEQEGNGKMRMTLNEMIAECKLFYVAGEETTRNLLAWTFVLLGKHQNWQERAREEVFRVFGKKKPEYDGLSQLKVVGMILYEVLRLYPPVPEFMRTANKDMKLGELSLPKGVIVVVPVIHIHYDTEIWGCDAGEFNPERFSGGIANAAKNQYAFLPFSSGPRVCIGQNFALLEAKVILAMILQQFSFELSPSYAHSPHHHLTLQPQHGVQIFLHKI